MKSLLIIINDPPYHKSERAWNGLRVANTAINAGSKVNIFLLSNAVYLARRAHNPPENLPNLETMLKKLLDKGVRVKVCTTCVTSRSFEPGEEFQSCFIGTKEEKMGPVDLIPGVEMGTMAQLFEWTQETERIVSF